MHANYSELHSRLNHLVNYSSQLIFVSSESIAEQHRTLEAFMAEQSEQTEVAFITAQSEEHLVSYRRQLCRQLIGQVAGSFVRPLNELLVSLNHHDGPVLIGITQAHHLPNSFLQELWDLVLQSRFAANKQHLNIVLFGDSQWAEEAQSWLPSKNTATPLLLSSESFDNVETELEQLIASKRAAFQQRLADRYEHDEEAGNKIALIRKPWFSLVIIGFFSVFFTAILGWQYPEKMQSLLGMSDDTLAVQPVTAVESPRLNEEKMTEIAQSVESEGSAESAESAESLEDSQDLGNVERLENVGASITEQILVTQWQPDTDTGNEIVINQQPIDEVQSKSLQPKTPTQDEVAEPETAANPNWPALPALDNGKYLIQLAGLKDIDLALQYLADQNLLDTVWLYKTQRYGGDWYVIVYARIYDSLAAAQAGLPNLPEYESQSPAFIKSSQQINTELSL